MPFKEGIALSSIKDLINSIKKLGDYMISTPKSEREIHLCLGIYLRMSGYEAAYVDKPVDFIVKLGRTEVPIEVKLNPSSEKLDDCIDNLYEDMKKKGWDKGILVVIDTTKSGKAFAEAERIKEKEKYGRKIHVVGVRFK